MNEMMTQTFGASGINREMFNDCFDEPIDMSNVSDDMMYKLAEYVEGCIREMFPEVADEMFRIWTAESPTEDELDYVAVNCCDAWKEYWEVLGKSALNYGGKVTACDLDEDE